VDQRDLLLPLGIVGISATWPISFSGVRNRIHHRLRRRHHRNRMREGVEEVEEHMVLVLIRGKGQYFSLASSLLFLPGSHPTLSVI
jgi:hypothetical protein